MRYNKGERIYKKTKLGTFIVLRIKTVEFLNVRGNSGFNTDRISFLLGKKRMIVSD